MTTSKKASNGAEPVIRIPASLLLPNAETLPPRFAGAAGALFAVIAGISYRTDVTTFVWIATDNVPPEGKKDILLEVDGVSFLQLDRDTRFGNAADATIALVDVDGMRTMITITPPQLELLRAYGNGGLSKGGES